MQEKPEEVEDSILVWNNNAKDVLNQEFMLALIKNERQANEILEDLSSQCRRKKSRYHEIFKRL